MSTTPSINIRKSSGLVLLRELVKKKNPLAKKAKIEAEPEHHSVEQFIKMCEQDTKKREPETERSYSSKIWKDFTIADKEVWLEWRAKQELPSASMIGSYYGFGYKSFNAEFKQLVSGKVQAEDQGTIARKMMDHGNQFEPEARQQFYSGFPGEEVTPVSDGDHCFIFDMFMKGRGGRFMATPDCYFRIGRKHLIAEIKCPANGIVVRKKPLFDVALEHQHCYPAGRPGHVLQAAVYALCLKCEEYYLFYYFTNGIDAYWVRHWFKMVPEMEDFLFDAIVGCWDHLEKFNEGGRVSYPKLKKAETLQRYKEKMESIVEKSLLGTMTGNNVTELQKDAANDSEQ